MKKKLICMMFITLLSACSEDNKATPTASKQSSIDFVKALNSAQMAPKSCNEFKVANITYTPSTFVNQCWEVTLPEDYNDPANGKSIKLAVAKANSVNASKGAIVYFTGGPGGSAIVDSEDFKSSVIRENNDVYIVDQRGTGFSSPSLFCQFSSSEDETKLKQCKSDFENKGVNLNAYNSKNNALDMIVLRKLLTAAGELKDKWTLVGGSYGTRLAITVLREEDQLTKRGIQKESGVKAMVLDGVFPVQISGISDLSWANYENLNRIMKVCGRSTGVCDVETLRGKIKDKFEEISPELRQSFLQLLLRSMPIAKDDTSDPDDIRNTILTLVNKSKVEIEDILKNLPSDYDVNMPDYFTAMGLSVACSEEYEFAPYYKEQHTERKNWAAVVQNVIDNSFHMGFSAKACKAWNVKKADSIEGSGYKNGTVPVLITNGGNDAETPPAWGELVAKDFKNSRSVTDDTLDHVVLFAEGGKGCMHNIIQSFVEAPSSLAKIDVSCLASKQFVFQK